VRLLVAKVLVQLLGATFAQYKDGIGGTPPPAATPTGCAATVAIMRLAFGVAV
jgi:hypothetical protein